MKTYNAQLTAARAIHARPDHPATAILHDSANARIVVFRVEAGQKVAPHASGSTVILSVVEGSGIISGGMVGTSERREVSVGDIVVFEPHERHGMEAVNGTFVLVATLAPRPAG
jgi:quercetin dioxygenase-like cupin family protein